MQPEKVLEYPPTRLSKAQRTAYFRDGYLALPGAIAASSITKLRAAADEMVEQSRTCTTSNDVFALEEDHSAEHPRLHRLYSPQDHHPAFWAFIRGPEMTALAADVVGPGVKFHHAKLNYKSGRGSRGFKWHQDIQAWPHTDYSPVTIGVYLEDCDAAQGPLSMVPGSHKGPLYTMYDQQGRFAVQVPPEEVTWNSPDQYDSPTGPAGTTVLLNCRTVHGSKTNDSDRNRPLLLVVYSSADSFSYTASPIKSPRLGSIVRGEPATFASIDPRPCELPPDWAREGYGGPWKRQAQAEDR